ncbi:MAG: FIST N-terminal domain-containing protein [Candidatus Ozemobacteraceae bacterium]
MRIGYGISTLPDGPRAVERAIARALAANPQPQVALVFSTGYRDQELLFAELTRILPSVPRFGGSTSSLMTNAGYHQRGVSVLLLSSDQMEFQSYFQPELPDPFTMGEELGRRMRPR